MWGAALGSDELIADNKVIMNTVIKANGNLKSLINTTVGYVKINKSWINHNASYECAAWWQDSKIEEGVYPLVLRENRLSPNDLYLSAELNAVVVDDFFPSLWGGVAIGNTKLVAKDIGSKRIVNHKFELIESITRTGNIPGDKIDICVNPLIWNILIDAIRTTLILYQGTYNQYLADYQEVGDGNYNINIDMMAYAAENIAALARSIVVIKRHSAYLDDESDYMRNLWAENVSWLHEAA